MSRLNVHLFRDSFKTPWGFRLQGGKDLHQPLTVQRVFSNSPAEGELQRGDVILAIGHEDTTQLTHKQAQDAIKHGGGQINLIINRPPPGAAHVSPLSPPIITQRPRAPSFQDLSPHSPHHRPIHITTNNNRDPYTNHSTMPVQNSYHRPPQSPSYSPYYQHSTSINYQPPRRQRDPYSQPPFQSPTTPTTPPPPWATQQAAPKKVSKLSEIGGGGMSFGTHYNTLPRRGNRENLAQYATIRPMPARRSPERDENEEEPDRLATGPIPRVCSRSNLGGGGYQFGSSYGSPATLPRRNVGRRLSQPPSMPSSGNYGFQPTKVTMNKFGGGGPQFGTDYNYNRAATTPAQRYEPQSGKGVMLNRVQSSLDNITLTSPRTPEPAYQDSPFFPQYSAQPPPQQVYTPTGLLLEQQRLQEEERKRQKQLQQQHHYPQQQQQYEPQYYQPEPSQHPQQQQQQQQQQSYEDEVDEGEANLPVFERRKLFQEGPPKDATVRTPKTKPPPKVLKPKPGSTSYGNFGVSYGQPAKKQQSIAVWQPTSQPQSVPVSHYNPPQSVHEPVKSTPPAWQRPQDDLDDVDNAPAWRNTLRNTGVKQWDTDVNYTQQPVRSVPYNPTPYQNTPQQYNPAKTPVSPVGDSSDTGPKVVHLQYNSPMGLYSNDNVQETLRGQTSVLSGQSQNPQTNQTGDRDWTQSAVLRFIEQESRKPKGRSGPVTAPKPAVNYQQPQQNSVQQHYYQDVGVSDF